MFRETHGYCCDTMSICTTARFYKHVKNKHLVHLLKYVRWFEAGDGDALSCVSGAGRGTVPYQGD